MMTKLNWLQRVAVVNIAYKPHNTLLELTYLYRNILWWVSLLSVCPSVRSHIPETTRPNFSKFLCMLDIWCSRTISCDTLCNSGFIDDVARHVYSWAAVEYEKHYSRDFKQFFILKDKTSSTQRELRNGGEVCYLRLPSYVNLYYSAPGKGADNCDE